MIRNTRTQRTLVLLLFAVPCLAGPAADQALAREARRGQLQIGGKYYKNSNIRLGKTDVVVTFKGNHYLAKLDRCGVLHVIPTIEGSDGIPLFVVSNLWEDQPGKDYEGGEVYEYLKLTTVAPNHFRLTGSNPTIGVEFAMEMKFSPDKIWFRADATSSQEGEHKVTFWPRTLKSLSRRDDQKLKEMERKAVLAGLSVDQKKYEFPYATITKENNKKVRSVTFGAVELSNHQLGLVASFDARGAQGRLDAGMYEDLKTGFLLDYRTSSRGNIDLNKNVFTLELKPVK